ncbi:MAG: hypothetical protein L0Z53_16595 [Acidobacteriales bacterium]|nr:hypothetical protein [Terriglobales bacterium]
MHKLFSVALLLGVSFLTACDCENTVVREGQSPEATRKAVVFERYCGANDGRPFTTQVSIVNVNASLPWGEANAFTARHDGINPVNVSIEWESEDTLLIRHPQDTRVLKKENRVGRTAVRYVSP